MAFSCCKSNAVVEQVEAPRVAVDANNNNNLDPKAMGTTTTSIKTESSEKSNSDLEEAQSYEGFFKGDKYAPVVAADADGDRQGQGQGQPVDKYAPSPVASATSSSSKRVSSFASTFSIGGKSKSRTTSSSKSKIFNPSVYEDATSDTDDGIITVFSEPTVDPRSRTSKVPTIEEEASLDNVTLADDAYVLLPDVTQRGYEPWGIVTYPNKEEWIRTEPYKVGTLVWFRRNANTSKFKWYIPGRIKNYVFGSSSTGCGEVTGYEIDVDCEDETMHGADDEIVEILKNAPPAETMLRWDGVVPSCPVPGIDVNIGNDNTKSSAESRIDKARTEYGDDFGFEGAKQNGIGPTHWGLTKEQIFALQKDDKYHSNMTMYDVVNEIVKPKTAGTGMGYALTVNKKEPLRAKVMVSHAWGEKFEEFASALRSSPVEGPFWVCALSIYQNEDMPEVTIEKQLGPEPETGPFATVLKQAEEMIAIMTTSADIYIRLWCVYEIFIAIKMNVPVSLLAFNEITTSMGGSDAMYSNAVLDSSGKPVVTYEAKCGMKEDQDRIQGEITKMTDGFNVIDDAVMWIRIKALTDDMEQAQMRSWMETTFHKPIGSCSASNIVSRQNAGIANAIEVWEKAKASRGRAENYGRISSIQSVLTSGQSNASIPAETDKGTLETIQEKFLCGSLCF